MADFAMVAGDSRTYAVTVTDEDGLAVNLGTAAIEWSLARGPGLPAILERTTGAGVTVNDPAGGVFSVKITSAETEAMSGVYYHSSRVTIGQDSDTVDDGLIVVTPGIIGL